MLNNGENQSSETQQSLEIPNETAPLLATTRGYQYGALSSNNAADSVSVTAEERKASSDIIAEDLDHKRDTEGEGSSKSPFLRGRISVSRFRVTFCVLWINNFIAAFDTTIMVSSHPVVSSYFGASKSAAWLSTSFVLTSTVFQPMYGRLSKIVGRKPLYLATTGIFLLANIWCALAQSIESFILARAFCGIGAGGLLCLADIMLNDLVPMDLRGIYQAWNTIGWSGGASLGAALGGAIADHLGWRFEFGFQIPGIICGLIVTTFCLPDGIGLEEGTKSKGLLRGLEKFDLQGSILLTIALTSLILGIVKSLVENPLMPLSILRHNPRAGLLFSNVTGFKISNAVTFNIPILFQAVLLESPTKSGLRLTVPSIVAMVVGSATGLLIIRFKEFKSLLSSRAVIILGGTCALTAMTMLSKGSVPDWVWMLFLVPTSIGTGLLFPSAAIGILAASKPQERAVVASAMILWRSVGHMLGIALSSFVLQNALFVFLNQKVTGPDKEKIILEATESVRGIAGLDPVAREQVIDSYSLGLRATFMRLTILAAVTILIVLPLRLPKLARD